MHDHDPQIIDLAVFIGRFRPFHNGHMFVIREALARAHALQILVGSSNAPRSLRNPFTFDEVREMIFSSLTDDERLRVVITPLEDAGYNDELWVQSVQTQVASTVRELCGDKPFPRVSLIGYAKDHSSYYLKLFPQWTSVGVPHHRLLSATDIRGAYFGHLISWRSKVADAVPAGTMEFLEDFVGTAAYRALFDEHSAVIRQRKVYEGLPYPPIFVTVDAVVIQSGHVLMIRRADYPGKGLLALPGGYVNANEPISIAWVRELEEETGLVLNVGESRIRGSLAATHVFDDPNRDDRGRMITHAHLVHLPPGPLAEDRRRRRCGLRELGRAIAARPPRDLRRPPEHHSGHGRESPQDMKGNSMSHAGMTAEQGQAYSKMIAA